MISKHSMDNSNITNSYFKINGENYLIDFEKSQWFISKLGNTLATEIFLTSPDIKGDKQKKLLSEYQDDGQIKISLEAFGIFANGVPFGDQAEFLGSIK
ncbi:hypothetical protein PQ465_20575 [Sphingobacterium oryzagri]|uniref:Uncharacterized protein n=1 Tax=Sphingobacterium oryzagri TaxID=3025669 RepID=A0ABY7WGB6_9SPHI|nr:hypothetical protein [Sphingobacterium sp. KACC 22765]WDF68677.1 hypothetical protein PQ465_20575 [Sphingobacterium sp. KACC 22765]